MNNRKKLLQVAGFLIMLAGAVLFVKSSVALYQERKAAEAVIQEKQSQEEILPTEENVSSENVVAEEETVPELQEKIEKDGAAYERNPNIRTYLFLGIDRKGGFQQQLPSDGGQADGIFLVIQDVTTKHVKLLMIPRDTMTAIRLYDLAGNYIGQSDRQITLSFAYGDGLEKSCRLTAAAVSQLLGGVKIDEYMAITIDAVSILNEQVDGVPVYIDDPYLEQKNPNLKYGTDVILKGEDAESYLRIRNIEEDNTALSRMSRHIRYIKAWMSAAHQAAAADDRFGARLMEAIQPYMLTSMPKDRYLKLGLDVLMNQEIFADEDVYTIPGTPAQGPLHDEYYADQEGIEELVMELFYRPSS